LTINRNAQTIAGRSKGDENRFAVGVGQPHAAGKNALDLDVKC
jgi:hypothetical protein